MSTPQITVVTDRSAILDAGGSRRFALVRLLMPPAPAGPRMPVNLVLAIDRSSSMSGQKIELAKQAVSAAIERLSPADSFAIVAYDEHVEVIVSATLATPEAQRKAIEQVRAVKAWGSTDLCAGWQHSCEQAARNLGDKASARVILTTDGQATTGITDPVEISRRAEVQKRKRILTSTIGVGQDFDELMLASVADAGGGRFYYAEKNEQLAMAIDNEVGEALSVVGSGVQLFIEAPTGTAVESLNGHPILQLEKDASIRFGLSLGDLVSSQQLTLSFKMKLPAGKRGERCSLRFSIVDRERTLCCEPALKEWTWVSEAENEAQPHNPEAILEAAKLFAAQARLRACKLNRDGQFVEAELALMGIAKTLRQMAAHSAGLWVLVARLEQEAALVRRPLASDDSKTLFTRGYTVLHGLDELSRALRSSNSQ